jgi:hypothetical protein
MKSFVDVPPADLYIDLIICSAAQLTNEERVMKFTGCSGIVEAIISLFIREAAQ